MKKVLLKKVLRIDDLLARQYGQKVFRKGPDPLTELVFTVLSQNTSDTNRDRAFRSLKSYFPTWESVIGATPARLAMAIKAGGLSQVKSVRIIKLLRSIKMRHGRLSLDFLRDWPDNKVRDYLLAIDGIGPKTVACVMAFSLRRNVMPVDTHVHRVSVRLGIIDDKMSAEEAHDVFLGFADLSGHMAAGNGGLSLYQLHLNIIEHGRKICRARNPLCQACVIRRLCKYYAGVSRAGRARNKINHGVIKRPRVRSAER